MSKLVSTYAAAVGLQIDRKCLTDEFFYEFYPLPFEKYITVQSSSVNQGAKSYDLWPMVMELLLPRLESAGIKVVHIGGKDDTPVPNTIDLRGKTTLHQSAFVAKNALAHMGVDSCFCHLLGAENVPIVEIFGSTTFANHGPYWFHPKSVFIESHRFGRKPSYSTQEAEKTINLIRPEEIADAILKILGLPATNHSTLFVGCNYTAPIMELVPNVIPDPNYNPQLGMIVRMDKHFDEQVLGNVLITGRKVNILTSRPLSKDFIGWAMQYRDNIVSYTHELDLKCPPSYVHYIKRLFPNASFFTKSGDEEEVKELKYRMFDITTIIEAEDRTREAFKKECEKYLNKSIDIDAVRDKMEFKSSKYILFAGNVYLSYAHLKHELPYIKAGTAMVVDGHMKAIDEPEFWADMDSFNIVTRS